MVPDDDGALDELLASAAPAVEVEYGIFDRHPAYRGASRLVKVVRDEKVAMLEVPEGGAIRRRVVTTGPWQPWATA